MIKKIKKFKNILLFLKLFLAVLKNKFYSANKSNYNGEKVFYENIQINENIYNFFPS